MLFVHANNIRIENIYEECSYNGGHCVELVACSNVVVKNCNLQMKGTNKEDNQDEPLQLDHANKTTSKTVANLRTGSLSVEDVLNNNSCKNVQITGCTLQGGRGLCSGHCGTDATPKEKFHYNVVVQNSTITGQSCEALALYDVVGCDVSGNVIRSNAGIAKGWMSDGMCIRIPKDDTAPAAMGTSTIMVRNNIVFGGRNGIVVVSDSASKFGKVNITGNVVFYKGMVNNAIIANSYKSLTNSKNETCKGW